MQTQINVHLDYAAQMPCTVLLQIAAHNGDGQRLCEERLNLSAHSNYESISGDKGIGTRTWLTIEDRLTVDYQASVEITRPAPDLAQLEKAPLHTLPAEAVTYLMTSRYCPAAAFGDFLPRFGDLTGGPLIAAMADWIHDNIVYDPNFSNWQTTALDTFASGRGVCRDFAHLLISLARSSAIPARMASVYGPNVKPQDFHAVAEVWLDGAWHLVDPTRMGRADGLVKIGVGRDASDVAFLTAFGLLDMRAQSVKVTEVPMS